MREFLPRHFLDLPADGDDEAIVGRGPNILLRERAARLAGRRLSRPVGERQPNQPDDVAQVETFVRATGDLDFRPDSDPTGLFSAPLRDATRAFQRRSGLTVDGIVNPDGETFDALRREIGLDEEEAGFGRAGADVTDPDGSTRLGLRCRQIAVRLGNLALDLKDIEQTVEQNRQAFEQALERVRQAAVAKATQPAEVAAAVAGIASSLATGNLLFAAAEAIALGARLADIETGLNVESRVLSQTADALRDSLEGRNTIASEAAELEAERDRLGCSAIGF